MEKIIGPLKGDNIPRLDRFVKLVGKAIDRFSLAGNGKIVIGVSGGKDSLCLAFALRMLEKWHDKNLDLRAVQVDWREFPLSVKQKEELEAFFALLEIPFKILDGSMKAYDKKDKLDCYRCSKNRKSLIFKYAELIGRSKIAYGHNLDDFIETDLMNLLYRGKLDPMKPSSLFFDGRMEIIRPLCLVSEKTIGALASEFGFPVTDIDCPNKKTNKREYIKSTIKSIYPHNLNIKKHIFEAYAGFYVK